MSRVLLSIAGASLIIALPFGIFSVLAFPVVLFGALCFAVPILLLFKARSWVNWWHALVAGAVATIPYIALYLSINPAHTLHVGLYNSVYALGMGLAGGLFVWLFGIFRNPRFMSSSAEFPKSIVLAVPLFAAAYVYHDALRPIYVYGCIVDYRESANPSSWHHADVSVVTDEGERFDAGVDAGRASSGILGNCAWGSKKRTALLNRFTFTVHAVSATGCRKVCPAALNGARSSTSR